MLTFATPAWLFALGLLPLIRWLHRAGRRERTVLVSSLELWRAAEITTAAVPERRPPDPAWRRRALIAALLCLALAGPQWPVRTDRVTLWIDDSLSMLTREDNATRLEQGVARARAQLEDLGDADVEVRTLGKPWDLLGLTDAAAGSIAAHVGEQRPEAPPEALLRGDRLHWLVTDGAHPALFVWPKSMAPDRVIQAGAGERNVGLELLSARRSLAARDRYDVLVRVSNGGRATETRDIVLAAGANEVAAVSRQLAPGESASVHAAVPAAAELVAMLRPGDALAEDDRFVLDTRPLRRRAVSVDAGCPPALRAAVAAHPALSIADTASRPEVALDCSGHAGPAELPMVRVLQQQTPRTLRGDPQWSAAAVQAQRIDLRTRGLSVAARLDARPDDTVLLAFDGEPVIVARPGGSTIESSIDFASADAAHRPELALLVDFMFERALGTPLLDAVAVVDRGPGAANVVPVQKSAANATARTTERAADARRGAWALVALALAALLWELGALGAQWRRMHAETRAA